MKNGRISQMVSKTGSDGEKVYMGENKGKERHGLR